MRIEINGTKIYFDVAGQGLVASGATMRERPTIILLHGGPGADHSIHKPAYDALSEFAQVIYIDHRGNGRSAQSDPEHWTLAQWGDDLHAFCEALDIQKPVVMGTSFGGFVAQSYATRYPEHVGKLILISTAAKFDFEAVYDAFGRLGGDETRHYAQAYWGNPTSQSRQDYAKHCVPYYSTTDNGDPNWLKRVIMKDDVALHFNGPRNEHGRMDYRADLGRVTCPVLLMVGDKDPITPPVFSDVIADHLTNAACEYQTFKNCGHGIVGDDPDGVIASIRDFMSG